jgi:hypothetical protein
MWIVGALLHIPSSETLKMLEETYGKAAVKKMQVYRWRKCFHVDRVSVNGDLCGRPTALLNDTTH